MSVFSKGVSPDHVEILVSEPPDVAPGENMLRIKGPRASEVSKGFPALW